LQFDCEVVGRSGTHLDALDASVPPVTTTAANMASTAPHFTAWRNARYVLAIALLSIGVVSYGAPGHGLLSTSNNKNFAAHFGVAPSL